MSQNLEKLREPHMNSFFVKLLETMVERPLRRPLTDDFGSEVLIPGFGELPLIGDSLRSHGNFTTIRYDFTT